MINIRSILRSSVDFALEIEISCKMNSVGADQKFIVVLRSVLNTKELVLLFFRILAQNLHLFVVSATYNRYFGEKKPICNAEMSPRKVFYNITKP